MPIRRIAVDATKARIPTASGSTLPYVPSSPTMISTSATMIVRAVAAKFVRPIVRSPAGASRPTIVTVVQSSHDHRHVSLLRGINVGGHNLISMARLRALYVTLGCEDVETYLQSGNVVFRRDRDPAGVGRGVERAIKRELGLDIRVLDRTHAELARHRRRRPVSRTPTRAVGS